jgi:hypothetical protein
MAVFWNVASCLLVDTNRRFRGAYCLHGVSYDRLGDGGRLHAAASQNATIVILLAVRT